MSRKDDKPFKFYGRRPAKEIDPDSLTRLHPAKSLLNLSSAIQADVENGSAEKTPVPAIREFLTVHDNPTDALGAEKNVPKMIVKRRHTFSGGKKRVSFDLDSNETFFFQRDDTPRYSVLAYASVKNNDEQNDDEQIIDKIIEKKLPSTNVLLNELGDAEVSVDSSNGNRVAAIHSIDSPNESSKAEELVETNHKRSGDQINEKKLSSTNVLSNELGDAESSAISSKGKRVAATHPIDSPNESGETEELVEINDKRSGDQIIEKKLSSTNVLSNELGDAETSAISSKGKRVAATHPIDSPNESGETEELVEINDKRSDNKTSDEMSTNAANSSELLEHNSNIANQCDIFNGPSCSNTKEKMTKEDSIESDSGSGDDCESDDDRGSDDDDESDCSSDSSSSNEPTRKQPIYTTARLPASLRPSLKKHMKKTKPESPRQPVRIFKTAKQVQNKQIMTRQLKRWFDGFAIEKLTLTIKRNPQAEVLAALQVPRRIIARRNTVAVDERVDLQIIAPTPQPVDEAPKPARITQRRNTTAIEKAIELTNNKVKNYDTLPLAIGNAILPPKSASQPMQSDVVKINDDSPNTLHLNVPLESTSHNSIAENSKIGTLKENPKDQKTSEIDRIHLRWNVTANEEPIDLTTKGRRNDDIPKTNDDIKKANGDAAKPLRPREIGDYVPRALFPHSNESTSHNEKTQQTTNQLKKNSLKPNNDENQRCKFPVPNLVPISVLREKNTVDKHHPKTSTPNLATHPLQYAEYVENMLDKK